MTREQIARRIHWPKIIWFMGLVNVAAELPQLFQLLATHETKALNVTMFWIFLSVQASFGLQGYFQRDRMLMWCLGLSGVVSALMIFFYYRYR